MSLRYDFCDFDFDFDFLISILFLILVVATDVNVLTKEEILSVGLTDKS